MVGHMYLQRRAIYNLVNLHGQEEFEDLKNLEPWQKENYRSIETPYLYKRLHEIGLSIPNEDTFSQFADEYESPDDMVGALTEKWEPLDQDKAYLLVFELWRRMLPEKRCPSVFCDELDYQISEYEKGNLELQEALQDIISYLQQILDDHVDEGNDPLSVINTFQTYCAHNIELFVFNYAQDAIESGDSDYAYDLIEGFYRYVNEPLWFDFLLCRIAILDDPEKGTQALSDVIKHVKSLDIADEILVYLAKERNHPLFCQLVLKILPLLESEEEFCELLESCSLHFSNLELNPERFDTMLSDREGIDPQTPLDSSDLHIKEIRKFLSA
ncbi:MAG: hypothetical protein ACKVOH_01880 [Chlamydiales bacterium]